MDDFISKKAVIKMILRCVPSEEWATKQALISGIEQLPSINEKLSFLEFLFNTINPNKMEEYMNMFHSRNEKYDCSDVERND